MLNVAARAAGGQVLMVSCLDAEHPAENIIDGSDATCWLSTGLFPQEILLQLGRQARISSVRLSCSAVREVRIEGCQEPTPVNFRTLAEGSVANAAEGRLQSERFQCAEQGSATAYVRVTVLSGWLDFCSVHGVSVEAAPDDVEESHLEPETTVSIPADAGPPAAQAAAPAVVVRTDEEEEPEVTGSRRSQDEPEGGAVEIARPKTGAVQDRASWLEHVRRDGLALRFAGSFSQDRQVALAAVRQSGDALQFAPDELRTDREVALAAVGQKGRAVQWASLEMQGDREVALQAVRQNGNALQYLSAILRTDPDVVMAAVGQHGSALRWAGPSLLQDAEVVSVASRTYYWSQAQLAALADGPEEESDDSDGDGN